MSRPTQPRRVVRPLATPIGGKRRNHGWGKLVGATVFGVAGALSLALPGAVTGLILGAALGHWFDTASADAGGARPVPRDAHEIAQEAATLLAGEVGEAFAALERAAGKTAQRGALAIYVRQQLGVDGAPPKGTALPWQQDLASACTRLAEQLDRPQKEALVLALYDHAQALGLGAGPARLLLRDGVEALGVSEADEAQLRDAHAVL